jgi:hypothetical protein
MTHPGTPRDVNLDEWLDGIGFHPANSELKQLGHEVTRKLVAQLGVQLHYVLPPGRDKSITFTLLEDVLMRANRALAVSGGPDPEKVTEGSLRGILADGTLGDLALPEDPRIEEYKADQRALNYAKQIPTKWSEAGGHEYDATVATDDKEIKVEIHSSTASARVQLGVLCTNPERAKAARVETTPNGPFDGFYAGFTSSEQLAAFLDEMHSAGEVAFE